MNARLTLLGVLALATGCFNLPDETEVGRFACRVDADCLDGYRCDGGTCSAAAASDTTPPSAPANVTLNGTAQAISIGWTNPTSDFAGVWVVRKVGSLPAARLDGTRIYEGVGATTSDNQITSGTKYCYGIFAYDAARNFSAAAEAGCYTPAPPPRQVRASASWAPQWNDWAASTGSVACDPSTSYTRQRACYHGGERRVISLPATVTGCNGVTASDALGAFTWYCNADQVPVQILSSGLKPGKGLADLVDRAVPAWRKNSVTVVSGGTVLLTTDPEVWWDNPVKAATAGDLLSSGAIYVLSPAAADIAVPGGTAIIPATDTGAFTGSAVATVPVIGVAGHFTWVEGFTLQPAASSKTAILFGSGAVGVARSLSVTGGLGVILSNFVGLRLSGLATTGSYRGLELQWSKFNVVDGLVAANSGFAALAMSNSDANVFTGVRAFNGAQHGVQLVDSSANVFNTVTTVNNSGVGLAVQSSNSASVANLFSNVTSLGNGTSVQVLSASTVHTTFTNLVAQSLSLDHSSYTTVSDAWLGAARLTDTSVNAFTGTLGVPNTLFCSFAGVNNDPGLDTSCATTSPGAMKVVGPTVTASFKREVSSDSHQSSGMLSYEAVTSWTGFDNPFRTWGRDLASAGYSAWPADAQTLNCAAGQTCHVWDFSLTAGDSTLLGRGTTAPTYTHTWTNYTSSAACGAMPTAVWNGTACQSVFNPGGIEQTSGDGLCQTGETCIRAPNLGAYQGSGTLVSDPGPGDVTYVKWSVNGEP